MSYQTGMELCIGPSRQPTAIGTCQQTTAVLLLFIRQQLCIVQGEQNRYLVHVQQHRLVTTYVYYTPEYLVPYTVPGIYLYITCKYKTPTPVGRISKAKCSTKLRVQTPSDASMERSRRDPSTAQHSDRVCPSDFVENRIQSQHSDCVCPSDFVENRYLPTRQSRAFTYYRVFFSCCRC